MERMKKWGPRWELNRKQDQSHLIDIWIFMGQTLTFVRLALVLLLWLLMGAMTARAHCYHRCSCTQTIQLPPKIFHHHLLSNQQIRQMKNHSTKINVIYVFALIAPHFHWPRARAWLLCVCSSVAFRVAIRNFWSVVTEEVYSNITRNLRNLCRFFSGGFHTLSGLETFRKNKRKRLSQKNNIKRTSIQLESVCRVDIFKCLWVYELKIQLNQSNFGYMEFQNPQWSS